MKSSLNAELKAAETDANTPYQYDLFIAYENEQYKRVKEFVDRLKEKNLKVFYNTSQFRNKASASNYKQLKNSATVLAIISDNFTKFHSCVEETTFAIRNNKAINIIIDNN